MYNTKVRKLIHKEYINIHMDIIYCIKLFSLNNWYFIEDVIYIYKNGHVVN